MRLLQVYLILVAALFTLVVGIRMIRYPFFFHMPFPRFGLGGLEFAILRAVGLTVLFVWIGVGVAVHYDAKRRGMEPLLWALVAALVPYLLGLIAYRVVRHPEQTVCAICGQPFTAADVFCRNCGHAVQVRCSSCGRPAASSARFCPNCGTPLTAPPSTAAV